MELMSRIIQQIEADKKAKIEKYKEELTSRLEALASIIWEGGTARGFGRLIGTHLHYLRELEAEDSQQHDALIAQNVHYKKLLQIFPAWKDAYRLESILETEDQGTFATLTENNSSLAPSQPDLLQKIDEIVKQHPIDENPFRAVREQRYNDQLQSLKKGITKILQSYSSPYKLSIFGHHHEDRVRAVIAAINESNSIEIITKILRRQKSLMADPLYTLSWGDDQVVPGLSRRWQVVPPNHRCGKSGYLDVINKAITILPDSNIVESRKMEIENEQASDVQLGGMNLSW